MTGKENGFFGLPVHAALVSVIVLASPFVDASTASASDRQSYENASYVSLVARESMQEQVLREIISEYFTYLSPEEKAELPTIILRASEKYGFDPLFAAGVIATESSFNNRAVSPVGARGLMQVMPYVGEALCNEVGLEYTGVEVLHDPAINIELGLYYLRKMEARFGDLDLALAAYNMGPTLLDKKMARGFRPHGIYAGRVNASYEMFRTRARDLHHQLVAEARL